MNVRKLFKTDQNNQLIIPTMVLCKADKTIIDTIPYYDNFTFNCTNDNCDEISFNVHKYENGELDTIYTQLQDFRLIYISEWEEYYQIQVFKKEDSEGNIKIVNGKSLCKAELSQFTLYGIEFNTESDISNDNYAIKYIYYPEDESRSLLHIVLKDKAPNYFIDYVSDSLKLLVRSFSIDNTTIDEFLTNTLAEELSCIVKYDSVTRSISLYDTLKVCSDCGYRNDYNGQECLHCGGYNLFDDYGNNTGIVISTKNLAEEISIENNSDEVKTCFKIISGDDLMNAAIRAVNPNGTQEIMAFSNEILNDMPSGLKNKIELYNTIYNDLQPAYQEITTLLFDKYDQLELYQTSMMPTYSNTTTATEELNKLCALTLGNIGVDNLSDTTPLSSIHNSVISIAKVHIADGYKVEILSEESFTFNTATNSIWRGKFHVYNVTYPEDDTATNLVDVVLTVTNDYTTFVQQKIDKALSNKKALGIDENWTLYSLDMLSGYESAYQSCLDVLIQQGISTETSNGIICKHLYDTYRAKLTAIQAEMTEKETTVNGIKAQIKTLESQQIIVNKQLNFKNFLGEELYSAFCCYRRDDVYENSNFVSDGLTNADLLRRADELVNMAYIELAKASQTQYTITGTIANFMLMKEFQHIKDECRLGNWIYIQTQDNDVYKLRLNAISGDYSSIDHLNLTFTNAYNIKAPALSLKDTIIKANSMSSTYKSVMHQATLGNTANGILNDFRQNGLNAALYRIQNADNQSLIIDEHGLLGREYDDITQTYSPEQIKMTNNLIAYTNDNWATVKEAIGKISYTDPETNLVVTKYGVIADTMIAGEMYGNRIVGGQIYSDNYWSSNNGTYINLTNGTFSLAGGKLSYDGTTLTGDGMNLNISANDSITGLSGRINLSATDIGLTLTNNYTSCGIIISMTKGDGTVEEVANGTIQMTGLVSFEALETAGRTIINGDNITTGTINADRIHVSELATIGNTVGGLNLENNRIYFDSGTSHGEIRTYNYNSLHRFLLCGENGTYNFMVNYDGALTSTKGTIGGLSISANGLTYGAPSGDQYLNIHQGGIECSTVEALSVQTQCLYGGAFGSSNTTIDGNYNIETSHIIGTLPLSQLEGFGYDDDYEWVNITIDGETYRVLKDVSVG